MSPTAAWCRTKDWATTDDAGLATGRNVYQLPVVIAGISPLIWRRLEVPPTTTIAGLHSILQVVFGWSGAHLHRFLIHGTEYGIAYVGGPGFRGDRPLHPPR